MQKNYKRTLITAALPYANGPVHIGHLAGVYIPADIYARYLRLKGQEVLFVCGSDEHGVPIAIRAQKEGVTPQDIVDRYHTIIRDSFARFGSRTTSPTHREHASAFFRTLYDKGAFIEEETEQYYDPEARQFLADRYIVGTCPRCQNEHAYGDQCESCGSTLNPTDLIHPHSAISGATPILKKTKHWYLPLDQYEPFLREWILEQHKEWKSNVYGQCRSWLDGGLQPRAVSRDLDWGIPVPVEGAEGKVLYVWFDAPIGYISNTKELLPDSWETWWKDEDTRLLHFIGKDNIVFHCIVFPAMLRAEGSYILPENVPANEFLNLEGNKISTSRNWAVWLNEYLDELPDKQDVLRYVLTANAPETLSELSSVRGAIERELDSFHFREALKEAMNLARLGNKYLADTEPWKLAKTDLPRVATILNISLQITANLTIAFAPFLPMSSERLCQMLQIDLPSWDDLGRADLLPVGHILGEPHLLFEKIEDEVIEAQVQKLLETKAQNEAAEAKTPPVADPIAFEDFQKLDIRVGTVLECTKVPKADKLLQFRLDDGLGGRTIISGLAEHYAPEELVGKQVCFIANLPPRKLRGIESEGMILSALDAETGRLRVITPEQGVAPGSEVK